MDWITTTFNWYIYLLILGLIAYPLTKVLFHSFIDRGYPFAKTIAVLILSFVMFVMGSLKILSFTQTNLVILISLCFFLFIYVNRKKNIPLIKWDKKLFLFIGEEVLFILSLFFLTYVRGQEPSIHGLEKFMDYGFINSIVRSQYFPPLDMWFAGGNPINYYYFGHLSGAILIKLTNVSSSIGYNLILATIFAQSVTLAFSFGANIAYFFFKSLKHAIVTGIIASFIVNLAGNLHTVYLFTTGYPVDNPIPFWEILSKYNPSKYWYPNATRFIPFTIHEFPSYSWVVADLHGHVFDIPFVILTLSILFLFFIKKSQSTTPPKHEYWILSLILGATTAIHYMTNAFDGPIYMLFTGIVLFVIFGFNRNLLMNFLILIASFVVFSYPFTSRFTPFVSGIGLNCSPDFLINLKKMGPFLFEKGNCQPDPFWMLFVLWGFFWICFVIFFIIKYIQHRHQSVTSQLHNGIDDFIFLSFTFGTILIFIPEFFYIKDIYPAHFRANTMFKMGYQAFIIMGFSSAFIVVRLISLKHVIRFILIPLLVICLFFVCIYPFYSFPAYYGGLNKPPQLDGAAWLGNSYPEDKEIVDFLNNHVNSQPTILEAQGDSYTDFNRISSYTGLPTVAGWWVHEWLWRGTSDVVGNRIPEIVSLYESKDMEETKKLIKKYNIKYIIVSRMEREKYKNLYEDKFLELGNKIFTSNNGFGALYQVKN